MSPKIIDERGDAHAGGAAARQSARPGAGAGIIVLLAVAMFINYADRGSLSIVAPVLKDKLAIDNAQLGVLLSAFFWTYALSQPIAGALVHRFDVRYVLAAGLALWAGATALSGLAQSFAMLLGLRFLVGFGESVIFPANARIIACMPNDMRGSANGLISAGMALGPSLGTLAGGLILAHWGWRAVFVALGGLSLLWLPPWLRVSKVQTPGGDNHADVPTFAEILRQRSLWGASIGHFCGNYPYYLMLTWMPLFLVKYAHFSLTAMAWIAAGAYAMQSLASIVGGRMSDRLIRNGADTTYVRKGFIVTGYVISATALLLLAVAPGAWILPCIVLDRVGTGLASPMTFAIGQTLGGPAAGGRWIGVQNLIGNLAGVAAPIVTGIAIDATGSFQVAFLIAVALMLVGIVCWAFVIEEIEPVAWRSGGLLPAEA